jgi:periplasmic protein TonB
MTGLATSSTSKRAMVARWTLAAVLALMLHGAPIGAWSFWTTSDAPPGVVDPPIAVELAALPSASVQTEEEVDVGPPSPATEETAPPPEEAKPEQATPLAIAPTPPAPEPEIVIPEKRQQAEPEKTPTPEVKKVERPAQKPKVIKEAKHAPQEQAARRQAAAPRADRKSDAMASAVSGVSSAAASASYYDRVKAQLQRSKQTVSGVGSASATFSFTVTRSGQVAGVRIVRSSGVSALDAEALAMVRRASPFPPFPPEMKEGSKTYTLLRDTR